MYLINVARYVGTVQWHFTPAFSKQHACRWAALWSRTFRSWRLVQGRLSLFCSLSKALISTHDEVNSRDCMNGHSRILPTLKTHFGLVLCSAFSFQGLWNGNRGLEVSGLIGMLVVVIRERCACHIDYPVSLYLSTDGSWESSSASTSSNYPVTWIAWQATPPTSFS
jgi:hypothetical protein